MNGRDQEYAELLVTKMLNLMQSNLHKEFLVYLHAAWVHFVTCWKLTAVLDIFVPFRSAKYNYQCGLLYFAERNGTTFINGKSQTIIILKQLKDRCSRG